MRFRATGLPAVPAGWRRDYLLLVDGWADTAVPPKVAMNYYNAVVKKVGAASEVLMTITTARFHRDRPVIGLRGIDEMNAATALSGAEMRVPTSSTRIPRSGPSVSAGSCSSCRRTAR